MPGIFSLNIHADYRCRHSGACCQSDWDVPVELPVYRGLEQALREGRVRAEAPSWGGAPPLVTDDLPPDAGAVVSRTDEGRCVFYARPSGLCAIHRDLGAELLPPTCRHFPRLAVRDARGTFISLTHYCPTAADMLFRDMPLRIVEDPPAFPPSDYEGLDVADDAWPPLLHPAMLMDLDGYAAWERHMVRRCDRDGLSPESVLATLRRDAMLLLDFDPQRESLAARIAGLPEGCLTAEAPPSLEPSLAAWHEVMQQAVPDAYRPAADEAGLDEAYRAHVRDQWPAWAAPLRRYVAAKAFANWTAYQGTGLRAIVAGLEAALALVRVETARQCRDRAAALDRPALLEGIRQAEWILNHLAGGEELAGSWSKSEHG